MAQSLEILIKAKNETDAAFKAITKNLDESAKAAERAQKEIQRQGMAMAGAHDQALKMNAAFEAANKANIAEGYAKAAAAIAAVAAVAMAVTKAVVDATLAAAAYGDKVVDLAGKTDLSTKSLQAFDVMARTGNTSVEAIAAGVLKMGRNIVAGADAFRRLGLDVEKLKDMSPEEQFKAVAVAIEGLGTNAERSAARVAIFGKSGDELTTVLHEAATGATELGGALSEDALQASADLQDQVDLLKTAWERVILQFGAAIAQSPEVQKGLEAVTNAVVFMAEKIGEWAPAIAAVFKEINHQIQLTMIGAQAATKAATGDMLGAWKTFKDGVENLHMEELFSDVKSGTSNNQKPRDFGPSAADIAKAKAAYAKLAAERLAAEKKAIEEEKKLREDLWKAAAKGYAQQVAEEKKLRESEWAEKKKLYAEELAAAKEADQARGKSYEEMSAAMLDAIEERRQAELDAQEDFANALGQLGDVFEAFGGSAGDVLASIARGFSEGLHAATAFAEATNKAQKAMAVLGAAQSAMKGGVLGGATTGAAFGAQFGILGAGIGAAAGALLGFFGKAKAAREEMEKLRNEFVKSAGGMDALKARAAAAGVSLDGMFKQKNAKALERQIDTIKNKLADWDNALQILRDGQEKWGIAVADMGPKFAGLELDKRAHEMVMFFAAAGQAGANMTAVTAGMAKDVNDLVSQYKAAGLAIPEAMRPMLEAMLKNKQLVDENGVAYDSFEEAGITFAQSMEGVLSNVADQIKKLMEVLARGFNIPITYDVQGGPAPPGTGGAGGSRPPREEEVPEFHSGGHTGFGTAPFPAMLRPRESVVPDEQMPALLAQAIALAAPMMGGGNQSIRIGLSVGNRELGQATTNITRRRQGTVNVGALRRHG